MGDISIKGRSPIIRQGYKSGGTVKVRDINKDGKKEGWEVARAKGMAKGMGKKGLWYNIHQKRKRGEKMRKKRAKGAPTDRAIRRSQG
jgi:ketol-acid reductoisomerase